MLNKQIFILTLMVLFSISTVSAGTILFSEDCNQPMDGWENHEGFGAGASPTVTIQASAGVCNMDLLQGTCSSDCWANVLPSQSFDVPDDQGITINTTIDIENSISSTRYTLMAFNSTTERSTLLVNNTGNFLQSLRGNAAQNSIYILIHGNIPSVVFRSVNSGSSTDLDSFTLDDSPHNYQLWFNATHTVFRFDGTIRYNGTHTCGSACAGSVFAGVQNIEISDIGAGQYFDDFLVFEGQEDPSVLAVDSNFTGAFSYALFDEGGATTTSSTYETIFQANYTSLVNATQWGQVILQTERLTGASAIESVDYRILFDGVDAGNLTVTVGRNTPTFTTITAFKGFAPAEIHNVSLQHRIFSGNQLSSTNINFYVDTGTIDDLSLTTNEVGSAIPLNTSSSTFVNITNGTFTVTETSDIAMYFSGNPKSSDDNEAITRLMFDNSFSEQSVDSLRGTNSARSTFQHKVFGTFSAGTYDYAIQGRVEGGGSILFSDDFIIVQLTNNGLTNNFVSEFNQSIDLTSSTIELMRTTFDNTKNKSFSAVFSAYGSRSAAGTETVELDLRVDGNIIVPVTQRHLTSSEDFMSVFLRFDGINVTEGEHNLSVFGSGNKVNLDNVTLSTFEIVDIGSIPVPIVPPPPTFVIGECPEGLPNILLLGLIIFSAFGIIYIGIVGHSPIIGILGSSLMIWTSLFVTGCSGIFGLIIALFGIVMLMWFPTVGLIRGKKRK